ncbi:hypothetical protein [Pedobacter gandavensis]|uniref:hypothetical protein n=1 Tax=Pedobacter gandavensis TaxID=2679963 RepID=UPI00292E9323|nr:hypothetical protein [Pedobacter gandavensis]
MGRLIKCMFIVFVLSTNVAFAQKGYNVDKDHRILKFQNEIINFLIQEKQISIEKSPIKMADYSGQIFIKKHVDIYGAKVGDVLLIQFGSLGDHIDKYWGLINRRKMFLFYSIDDPEFFKLTKETDPLVVATITAYIQKSALDE